MSNYEKRLIEQNSQGLIDFSVKKTQKEIKKQVKEASITGIDEYVTSAKSAMRDSIFGKISEEIDEYYDDDKYDYNPVDKKTLDKLWQESDIDDAYKERFYSARNYKHALDLKTKLEQNTFEDSYKENNALFGGVFYDMAFGVAEAVPLIVASASAPVTGSVLAATALRRFALGGIGYEGLLETFKHNLGDKERGYVDSAISMVSAGTMNALLGRPLYSSVTEKAIKGNAENYIREVFGLDDEKIKSLKATEKTGDTNKLQEEINNIIKDKKEANNLKEAIEQANGRGNMFKQTYDALRMDLGHLTKQSESELLSQFGKEFFYDSSFADMGKDKTYFGIEADNIKKQLGSAFITATNSLRKEFNETIDKTFASHLGVLETLSHKKDDLFELAGIARNRKQFGIEQEIGDTEAASKWMAQKLMEKYKIDADKAMDFARRTQEELDKFALEQHRILSKYRKDFKDEEGFIRPNKDYNHIVYNRNAIVDKGITLKDIKELIKKAIISNRLEGIDPTKLAEKRIMLDEIAELIADQFSKRTFGLKARNIKTELENEKELYELLLKYEKEGKLDKGIADKASGSMRRLNMDRSVTHKTESGKVINFTDLMENNIEAVSEQYSREMSGWTVLEKFKYKTEPTGEMIDGLPEIKDYYIKSRGDLLSFMSKVEDEINRKVANNTLTNQKAMAEKARLYHIVNHYIGKPTSSMAGSETDKWIEALKNFTNFKLLGQVGFSMPAEIINTIGYVGVKNFFQSAPEALKIMKAMKTGKIDDAMAQELFDVFNYGDDFLRGIGTSRYDQSLSPEMSRRTYADVAVNFSEKMAQATYLVSGMKHLTTFLQIVQASSMNRNLLEYATTGNKSGLLKRMQRNLNISDEKMDRIAEQMRKNQTVKTYKEAREEVGTIREDIEEEPKVEYTDENIKNLKDYVEGKSFKIVNINDKINDIPDTKLDTNQLFRAVVDYGDGSFNLTKDLNIGDTITLNRHLATSKNQEGLQNVVTYVNSLGKNVKEYMYIKNPKKGIDVNNVLGEHKFSNQNEILLKKNTKLKFIEEQTLNNKPFKIFEVIDDEPQLAVANKKFNTYNFDGWDNDVLNEWQQAVKIITDSVVQVGHLQDDIGVHAIFGDALLQDTPLGKLALSLKTYMIQSYTKQLGRTINTMDANIAMSVVAQGVIMSMMTAAQEYANYAGTDKLEEKLQLDSLIPKAIAKTTITSYLPSIVDAGSLAVTGESMMGNRYYQPTDYMKTAIAPLSVIDDMLSIASVPMRIVSGKPQEAEKDLISMAPNWYGLQNIKNQRVEELDKQIKDRKREERQTEVKEEPMTVEDLFEAF